MGTVYPYNLAAYDAYLRAPSLPRSDFGQNWEAERQALESLEQAVRLDPRFAAAHARLGWLHARMADLGYQAFSLGHWDDNGAAVGNGASCRRARARG